MATTITETKGLSGNNVRLLQWTLGQGETGDWAEKSGWSDAQVEYQLTGTAPTSIAMQGSLEKGTPTVGQTLRDSFENTLSLAANTLRQIHEDCEQIRPVVTGGDGTTSVVIIVRLTRVGRG